MEWKPNKYLAALLGLVLGFFAFFYVERPRWAVFYLVATLAVAVTEFLLSAPHLPQFYWPLSISPLCAGHAYFIASHSTTTTLRRWYSRWYGIPLLYLGLVVTITFIRSFLYEPYRVPSRSMFPTIPLGSLLVVEKFGYGNYGTFGFSLLHTDTMRTLQRGELVVFDSPDNEHVQYVKRVIGVPGDRVQFKNRLLTINGVEATVNRMAGISEETGADPQEYDVAEESLSASHYRVAYAAGVESDAIELTVPAHSYFVLGDNRAHSRDSRHWGAIPARSVIGRVVLIIPANQAEQLH